MSIVKQNKSSLPCLKIHFHQSNQVTPHSISVIDDNVSNIQGKLLNSLKAGEAPVVSKDDLWRVKIRIVVDEKSPFESSSDYSLFVVQSPDVASF